MKKESEILEELSRRAALPLTTVKAVVDALRDEVRRGGLTDDILLHAGDATDRVRHDRVLGHNHADPRAVDDLIARARRHRLGLEFLLEGYLGSVAAEFGTHAFTVEAARAKLRSEHRTTDDAS